MKKILLTILLIVLLSLFLLGFERKNNIHPLERYNVYLDGNIIGIIEDKNKFESYINKSGDSIKKKYGVDNVYSPANLEIEKNLTYSPFSDNVEKVYKKAESMKAFTIEGYQFNIKNSEREIVVYTSSVEIFEKAVRSTIETFLGKEMYNLYLSKNQVKLTGVGRYIDNIYLQDNISYKETRISVDQTIYTDYKELSKFLLLGQTAEQKEYSVKSGDTIESVSLSNKISPEEFLISNPSFNNKNNLLFIGQKVLIGVPEPQIQVAIEEQTIEESISKFKNEYKYDKTKVIGYEKVAQKGEDGLELITRDVKTVNGVVVYASISNRQEIRPAITQITVRGEKKQTNIASSFDWTFPTPSGYRITQDYEWRRHPITHKREFHQAIDIAIGYGASIYAVNNGEVVTSAFNYSYGNYIVINHNNGVFTLYSHLAKNNVRVGQIVTSGQTIGTMGSSGSATGPHLHFEYLQGTTTKDAVKLNPWLLFK